MEQKTFDQKTFQTSGYQVVILLLIVVITGCASYNDHLFEIRELASENRYQLALEKLERSPLKNQNRNQLLYHLEKAMLLDRLGKLAKSRQQLMLADQLVDQLYSKSISKEAASYLLTSDSTDYSGEDYEKIFIHTMLALSFIRDQQLSSALVEARRINLSLHAINSGRGDANNRYHEDAFARYLAGVIHETTGDINSAYIDYLKAWKLYRGSFALFNNSLIPQQLVSALQRSATASGRQLPKKLAKTNNKFPRQQAQVVVIHQLGRIAVKEAEEFMLPIGKQLVRISFPVIVVGPRNFGRTGVTIGSPTKRFINAQQMVNLDQIAKISLEDRRARLTTKQVTRLIGKSIVGAEVHHHLGTVAGLAFNLVTAATETADTRGWGLLPARIAVSRFVIDAGKTNVLTVKTAGVVTDVHRLKLKAGDIKLLVSIAG